MVRYNRQPIACLPLHQLTPVPAMATVDTAAQTRFWDSFSTSTEGIREGFSVVRSTAADGHWTKWAYFCTRVALDPLIVAYKDPVPILNAFARDYRTGNIAPNSRAVQSRMVEDAVRLIGQAITELGEKDPQMTSTLKLMRGYNYSSAATPVKIPLPPVSNLY